MRGDKPGVSIQCLNIGIQGRLVIPLIGMKMRLQHPAFRRALAGIECFNDAQGLGLLAVRAELGG